MDAGRELDVLVAQQIFGCRVERFQNPLGMLVARCQCGGDEHNRSEEPFFLMRYSTDIAAAWPVVEKLRELDMSVQVSTEATRPYCCLAIQKDGQVIGECAWTAPLAICLAALKAVGYKKDV